MGNDQGTADINVATLNYGGILNSPFEFHEINMSKESLSSKFENNIKNYRLSKKEAISADDPFKWKVGRIDMVFQMGRYTPIYMHKKEIVGVVVEDRKKRLVNKEGFEKLWDKRFKEMKQSNPQFSCSEQEVAMCRDFDFLVYYTFLQEIFHRYIPKPNQQIKQIFEQSSQFPKRLNQELLTNEKFIKEYQSFMTFWHSKTYLNLDQKLNRVKLFVKANNIDALFIQQYISSQKNKWLQLFSQEYEIKTTNGQRLQTTSAILVRKQMIDNRSAWKEFSRPADIRDIENDLDNLKPKDKTVYIRKGRYIFISSHFSSKKQKQKIDVQNFFRQLGNIKVKHKQVEFIIGLDSNHYLNRTMYQYNIAPQHETKATSIKKRTSIQMQYDKANQLDYSVKDHIVTTIYINEDSILDVNGREVQKQDEIYLPTEEHPFDHFIVKALIPIHQ